MYMKEVFIVKMEDLRFNLTEEMNNMMIEMLITQQMLKEVKNLSKRHRELLENHKLEVMEEFKKEFQKHNMTFWQKTLNFAAESWYFVIIPFLLIAGYYSIRINRAKKKVNN